MVLARALAPQRMPAAARVARTAVGASSARAEQAAGATYLTRAQGLARELTARGGPPAGLAQLLGVLGDSGVWMLPAARAALVAGGASVLSSPRALLRFAGWCGVTPAWTVVTEGGTTHVAVRRSARAEAQTAARSALRHTGVMEWGHLREEVAEYTGLTLRGDRADLAALLGVGGDQDFAWLVGRPVPQLHNALAAIAGAYEWVTVQDLAAAVARTRVGARAKVHRWPPTVLALLAWLPTLPGWSVRVEEGVWRAVPTGPPPVLNARDTALAAALRAGARDRGDLLDAVTGIGFGRSAAAVHPGPLSLARWPAVAG